MAYLTSYNDAIDAAIDHKIFGWVDGDKSYIVGDREITMIETRYCPPSDEMIAYVASMQSKGNYEEWLIDFQKGQQDVYDAKLAVISLALGSIVSRFMTEESYLINFVGNKNWVPLLYWVNSVFGDNFRLTGSLDKDKVKLFKCFPITCINANAINQKELESFLKSKHTVIFSVSDAPISFNHPKILNIKLPTIDVEIEGSLNQGVLIDEFLKRLLAYLANGGPLFFNGQNFWGDVISLAFTCIGLIIEDKNTSKLLNDALAIENEKQSPLMGFLRSSKDYTLILDRVLGHVAKKTIPIKDCKGDVYVRYEPNTKLLFVVKVPFRDYCRSKDVAIERELLGYRKCGALIDIKSKMMNGRYVETLYFDTTKLLGFDETQFINGKNF